MERERLEQLIGQAEKLAWRTNQARIRVAGLERELARERAEALLAEEDAKALVEELAAEWRREVAA